MGMRGYEDQRDAGPVAEKHPKLVNRLKVNAT
jgi:hypothetical protein